MVARDEGEFRTQVERASGRELVLRALATGMESGMRETLEQLEALLATSV